MGLLDGEGNCLECLQNGVLTSAKRAIKICETSTKRPGDMPKMSTEHRNVLEMPGNSSELLQNLLETSIKSSRNLHEASAKSGRNFCKACWKSLQNVLEKPAKCAIKYLKIAGDVCKTSTERARNVDETSAKRLRNVCKLSAKRARNLRETWSKRLWNGIETSVKGARKVHQMWPKH